MGGGLMQLVAYGAQDVYLTGNPQITFFKVVYRRHTNFAIEAIEQTFNGSPAYGNRVTCTISRNGDLIHRIYLQTTLPAIPADSDVSMIDGFGNFLVKEVELEIGGQRIDKQYGDWLNIWQELSCPEEKLDGLNRMLGVTVNNRHFNTAKSEQIIYTPLQFWFCRNPGLALPLIALQYHEVKINLTFEDKAKLFVGTVSNALAFSEAKLYVDYIYLDTEERRRFAQTSHEYLIEQLQYTGSETVAQNNVKTRLNFNHPVKELVWVLQTEDNRTYKQLTNYTTHLAPNTVQATTDTSIAAVKTGGASGKNPVSSAKLLLNGHDRFSERPGSYFNLVQPYQHHTRIPADSKGINVYSFALNPEEHQPSGTVNMSRIDNATLNITVDSDTLLATAAAGIRKIPTDVAISGGDRGSSTTSFVIGDRFTLTKAAPDAGSVLVEVVTVQDGTGAGTDNVPATLKVISSSGFDTASSSLTFTGGEISAVTGTGVFGVDSPTYQVTLGDDVLVQSSTKGASAQSAELRVYAVNYNVLRIMSGMAGVAYSN